MPEVLAGHHLDGRHRAAAAEHGAVVEDAPLVGGEAVEAGRHQARAGCRAARRARSAGVRAPSAPTMPGVAEQGDELLEEERVAAAAVEQRVRQLRAELGAGQLVEQLGGALGGRAGRG